MKGACNETEAPAASLVTFEDGHGLCTSCGKPGELEGPSEISDPVSLEDGPRRYAERWECSCGARWWEVFRYEGRQADDAGDGA